jgi:hypothetical protein
VPGPASGGEAPPPSRGRERQPPATPARVANVARVRCLVATQLGLSIQGGDRRWIAQFELGPGQPKGLPPRPQEFPPSIGVTELEQDIRLRIEEDLLRQPRGSLWVADVLIVGGSFEVLVIIGAVIAGIHSTRQLLEDLQYFGTLVPEAVNRSLLNNGIYPDTVTASWELTPEGLALIGGPAQEKSPGQRDDAVLGAVPATVWTLLSRAGIAAIAFLVATNIAFVVVIAVLAIRA